MDIHTIIAELTAEKARIEASIEALSRMVSTKPDANVGTATKRRKKRKLSADARKRIADAQRKRWAAQKAKSKQ